MDELSKKEKIALQKLMRDGGFEILQKVATALLTNMARNNPIIQDTEWLTAREAVAREERKRVMNLFLENLEKLDNA